MNKLLIHEFGKLKLDKNGVWYHNDEPFVHEGMSKLFSKNIIKDNGNYYLKIDKSQVPIEVEDVIIWIIDIDIDEKNSNIKLILSNGEELNIDKSENLYLEKDINLYYYIGSEKAKFTKYSFGILKPFLKEENGNYYFQIGSLRLDILS